MDKFKQIHDLEMFLMRRLTAEEIMQALQENSIEDFLHNVLELDEEDINTLNVIRFLIANYTTGDLSAYEKALYHQDVSSAYFLLKNILDDIEEIDAKKRTSGIEKCQTLRDNIVKAENDNKELAEKSGYTQNVKLPVDSIIDDLKAGKELELEQDVLDEVIDTLWNTEDNINIFVKNNKIRIK